MRFPLLLVALAALTAAGARAGHAAPTGQPVEFRNGDVTMKGMLFKPDGDGPFPAVVGMHGCEGLINPAGTVGGRYRDWAEQLGKAGFAVLYPDSLGPRGLGNQCRNRSTVLRTNRERVADANAARLWLQEQPFIKPDHISVVGWSNGAISALWTVRPRALVKDNKPDFRSAVAFYPGCGRLDATGWSARVPTLILIGSIDDWASSKQCEQMVAHARGRSARVSIIVYPGAYHDFDHPTRQVQMRTGWAFSVDGTGRVHTGNNPA